MTNSDSARKSQGVKNPLRSKREKYNAQVDFVVDSRAYMGIVKDKSGSGVFIEALDSFSEGQEITLSVQLSGDQKPIKRKGKIARTTSTGFGVEFNFR